ncbi:MULTISPECIES: acyl carrier protein [unclassified Gordonia (in: high G+C Gram-positive bacteria)]|uniref:acyl carrier protein n=2 Tax=Gordoniaceae TaxID=85026 RepID=UPI00071C2A94|nr:MULTISPECIES: phosphopantetheine-binding protein [unclassified Gordonia (in: high G+C Gram-positive bacteria)]KSU58221.1 phosphopantetheine-binding protein [Gordonia sp. SGD-V-85]MBR7194754.1 acyl carrier protein [Gordonia sp. SCSIO 19800]MDT0223236.1 phosphopantetheine-binding protein [Gordonia sp. AC31]SCC27616.1 acyl carrier protein [Gordonia sp. v-85]
MDDETITTAVVDALLAVAPELSRESISVDEPIREIAELDSVDWLSFLTGIKKRLEIEVPENDYATLQTVTDVVRYVKGIPR